MSLSSNRGHSKNQPKNGFFSIQTYTLTRFLAISYVQSTSLIKNLPFVVVCTEISILLDWVLIPKRAIFLVKKINLFNLTDVLMTFWTNPYNRPCPVDYGCCQTACPTTFETLKRHCRLTCWVTVSIKIMYFDHLIILLSPLQPGWRSETAKIQRL